MSSFRQCSYCNDIHAIDVLNCTNNVKTFNNMYEAKQWMTFEAQQRGIHLRYERFIWHRTSLGHCDNSNDYFLIYGNIVAWVTLRHRYYTLLPHIKSYL